jgi:hypothetical protein
MKSRKGGFSTFTLFSCDTRELSLARVFVCDRHSRIFEETQQTKNNEILGDPDGWNSQNVLTSFPFLFRCILQDMCFR